MIPKACRRLAAVDFPIAEVSTPAAREESIRHGHPFTVKVSQVAGAHGNGPLTDPAD
jgi:hypothetical protein